MNSFVKYQNSQRQPLRLKRENIPKENIPKENIPKENIPEKKETNWQSDIEAEAVEVLSCIMKRVHVKWIMKDGGIKWFYGTITKVLSDEYFEVHWDDGTISTVYLPKQSYGTSWKGSKHLKNILII